VRSSKAEKIFQQAVEDMAAGNLVSARTNLKLALTFDPGNERYKEKLAEVEQEGGPNLGSQDLEEVPKGTQFANQFYEKAIEQENQGNFDEAIRLLEKAIRADAQGVYYHRLGNILAFHKGQLKEGRNMVDKAIQRSPRNKNYQKTLSRILERMNGGEEKKNMANMLGGLLKRK
jgi:tetratricopeptide (TPR) repeat protein